MLKLIKDPVVGNTVLSEVESAILEMPVVNRLHHLMQNGLAYRVFPSNTTSRFEHSIGVMHLSGSMYCRAMANALPKTRDRFLLKAWRTVLAPAKGVGTGSDPLLAEADRLPGAIADLLGREFINHHPGPGLSFRVPHLIAAHVLLLQAVRLAGLLHDVGHFPCSHLFEDALRLLACFGMPSDLEQHLEKIRYLVVELAPSLKHSALHEQVGFLVARAVLYERLAKGGRTTPLKDAVAKRLVLATLRILGHKEASVHSGSIHGALAELLCGDLDADRLDFVLRDGRRTGLITASGDVDRILKMICLVENDKGFRFCPAIQTLNDVQQFLLDRLRLYQYVYNHHRVWRLENMLKSGIRVMLTYSGSERDQLIEHFADLQALGGELKPAHLNDLLTRIALRTDNWLINLVQNARQSVMPPEEKDRMEELFSGVKNWTTLWKREFEYRDFLIRTVRQWLTEDSHLMEKLYDFFQRNLPKAPVGEVDEYRGNLVKLSNLRKSAPEVFDENTLAWLGSLCIRIILKLAESKLVCQNMHSKVMICPTRFYPGINSLCLADVKSDERTCRNFTNLTPTMRYFQRVCERGIAMHVFVRKECDPTSIVQSIADLLLQNLNSLMHYNEMHELEDDGSKCIVSEKDRK